MNNFLIKFSHFTLLVAKNSKAGIIVLSQQLIFNWNNYTLLMKIKQNISRIKKHVNKIEISFIDT